MTPIEPGERFATLFREQQPALHAYLIGRTSDAAQAADLTQEVFLRAWRHLPELLARNTGGQRAWLFTVARNLAADTGRRSRTRAEVPLTTAAADRTPQRSAGEEVEATHDLDRISAAIAALPEDLRICLAMATTGGLTSQEIGAALDIPAGTVRYRLSRARALLLRALQDDEPTASATAPGAPHLTPSGKGHRP